LADIPQVEHTGSGGGAMHFDRTWTDSGYKPGRMEVENPDSKILLSISPGRGSRLAEVWLSLIAELPNCS
jgi:hypothetical protein